MAAPLGYTRDEVIGRMIEVFYLQARLPLHDARWYELLEKGTIRDADRSYLRKDGALLEARVSAILDATAPAASCASSRRSRT